MDYYSQAIAIFSLTMIQSVLMIDNVIFISVITDKLSSHTKLRARLIGLAASLVLNTAFILSAGFIIDYSEVEIFSIGGAHTFDLHHSLMLFGGLFLIWKTAKELRHKNDHDFQEHPTKQPDSLASTIMTMIGIDMVFSIDSTLTAIGMSQDRFVQVTSVLLAVVLMFGFFNVINKVTTKYPSLKSLALCFLFLIGFNLLMEGFGKGIEKGYTYFSMAFALFAEFIDIMLTNRAIRLKKEYDAAEKKREKILLKGEVGFDMNPSSSGKILKG